MSWPFHRGRCSAAALRAARVEQQCREMIVKLAEQLEYSADVIAKVGDMVKENHTTEQAETFHRFAGELQLTADAAHLFASTLESAAK